MSDDHYLKTELYQLMRSDSAIFEFLQEGSLDGIWYWDLEQPEVEWMSPRFWEVFGHDPAAREHLACEWQDMIHPDDMQVVAENFERHKADPEHPYDQVVRYRHKDGSTVWVRCRGLIIRDDDGTPRRMLGAHTELTALKSLEDEARRAREFSDSIIATIRQPLVVLTAALRVLSVNRAFSAFFGLSEDETKGKLLHEIGRGEWADARLQEALSKVVPANATVIDFELLHSSEEFGRRNLLLNARKMFRPGNDVETLLLAVEDVTAQRAQEREASEAQLVLQRRLHESQAELSRTEQLLLAFLDSIDLGIIVLDEQARPYFTNRKAGEILDVSAVQDAAGADLSAAYKIYRAGTSELYPADELPPVVALTGKLVTATDLEVAGPDGRVPLWVSASPVRDDRGRVVYSITALQDVSEQNRLEAHLRQAQKMEAVGRLAGGVAHDFNNLLTAIFSFSGFVMEDMLPEDPAYKDMQEVKSAAERAESLTRQLLAFSRKQVSEPKPTHINALVQNMERMLGRILGEDIEFSTSFERSLWNTKVDPSQIEQVVVNLAVNARDAMPNGGKLTIETGNERLDEAYATSHGGDIPIGDYVMFAITDNGEGMDKEVQSQIFEPFFTTKGEGRGTGLGLSTCYGIVKQAGGYLWVYSEVGRGTTFKVYLPRFDGPLEHVRTSAQQTSRRGSETVLVAEDDPQVRALIVRALSRYGYAVIEAANGGEAIMLGEQHTGSIDLLLTDVVMPRMSGTQLAARFKRLHPEARVLYISGYTQNAIVHHGVLEPGISLLQKPFTPDALAARIRGVLDEKQAPITAQLPRVLCVDDDARLLRAMRNNFKDHFDVTTASSGEAALALISVGDFELVLCDILMPDMNGLELRDAARQRRPDVADRFVFVTGALGTKFVGSIIEEGAEPVVAKPVTRDQVHALVASDEDPSGAPSRNDDDLG